MEYSLPEYADLVGKTPQAINYQIRDKRLPKGVKSRQIGKIHIITVPENSQPGILILRDWIIQKNKLVSFSDYDKMIEFAEFYNKIKSK